jgi:hypothetical protein
MTTTTTEHELNQMGLRDLQSRFREVVGEETRCPNKTFLVRRILAALAAQQANDTVSANMEIEAPSTSGAPAPEPEATAPPESERRPAQPAVETAVASLPAAEPTSAEPLADSSAIEPGSAESTATAPEAEPGSAEAITTALAVDPTSTEAIATAPATEPASAEPPAAELTVSQPFAEEPPGTEPPALADANVEPEEEAPATVVEPGPVTEAIPPRLALDDAPRLDKQPLDASTGDAFEDGLANDALEDASASQVGEDAPASNTVDDGPAQPAPSTSVPAAAPSSAQPTRGRRGRFRDMTVEQLQALYLSTVGRSSGSTDRRYLEWKIREAEKGRIPVGPRELRAAATPETSDDIRVLPLRLDGAAVDALDATWKSHGMKSRMDFFRRALGHYLAHLGANGAAMHFASQSAE